MNLSRFQRPSRYINNEINAVSKDAPVKVALAFPDIYDVGMSHLGLRILYRIINDLPYARAERVFHPWLDMAEEMRQKGIPLCSLESKTPIRSFDIVGFSLQYELSYTTVLSMLSLAGVPLYSGQRTEGHPLIIAGGPCTVNPLPMSAFIDAFLIGDGEDAIKEILETVLKWKTEGDGKRSSILSALTRIEGMYVPSLSPSAKRRITSSINDAAYPVNPIVPYTPIVHDRVNIEVSRGCIMGCRFCQAGMIYRPLRERSPEKALELAEKSLRATGYEEVSFTSLSAGDYSSLLALLKEFNRRFSGKRVSVSLPSLRVRAVNEDILKEIKFVRKTGFTIAPEAATERLRAVINKDFGEEDYERALSSLFKEGWHNIKLYFMLGLPQETDDDITAIPGMVFKALKTARAYTKRFVNINVSASPFVPKPHTPFQWCSQIDMADIKRKKDYLRDALRGINLKGHDERMSMLEAAFSRGDEKLSSLILSAYNAGSRLDAWTESFDFNIWLKAMDMTGIDAAQYARTSYSIDAALPWERINTGIKKEFLKKQYELSVKECRTESCLTLCSACGVSCDDKGPQTEKADFIKALHPQKPPTLLKKPQRLRVEFSKTGMLRYLSHRELISFLGRAIRRAGISLEFSRGFHPSPRLAFGPPLNVGVSGIREYFDMEVISLYDLSALREMLNAEMKDRLRLSRIVPCSPDAPSLQSFISRYEYEIICPEEEHMLHFLKTKKLMQSMDIGAMIEDAEIMEGLKVRLMLRDTADKKVRLDDIAREGFGVPAGELEITRLALYGLADGGWVMPINRRLSAKAGV